MADRTVTIRMGAEVSGLVSGMRQAAHATKDAASQAGGWVAKNEAAVSAMSGYALKAGAVLLGVAAVAVKHSSDFEAAMSSVAAATMAPQHELEALREAAIKAGADTEYSASEAAGAIEELAKAGVSTADILSGGLDGALSLAAAGQLDVADAAEIAATALVQFKLQGKDVEHVADLLAAGAGKAQGDVTDLSYALRQSGLVASQMGLSVEETTGTLAAFASAGLLGSDAGTSFRSMLLRLAAPAGKAAREMESLGLKAYDAQGEFIGMESLAGQLQEKLGGLTQEQRDASMAIIFGTDAIRAANVLYTQGAEGIADWTSEVDDSGYAISQARLKTDNLRGDVERLGGALDTALIQGGTGANKALRSIVQGATGVVDAIGKIPEPVLSAMTLIAGGAGLGAVSVGAMGKIAVSVSEARTAMTNLGLSMKTATLAAGGVGIAVAAVGAAIGYWANQSAKTKQQVETLKGTLDSLGEATDATADVVMEQVKGYDALVEISREAGVELGDLTGYVLGEADATTKVVEAISEYNAALDEQNGNVSDNDLTTGAFIDTLDRLKGETDKTIRSARDEAKQREVVSAALEDQTDSSKIHTSTLYDEATAVDDLTGELDELIGSLREATGVVMDEEQAAIDWERALRSATDGLAENGRTLDITTEAGARNRENLLDLADSAWDNVEAQSAMGRSHGELQATMRRSRDSFVETAVRMGMARDEAESLADELNLIPAVVPTRVDANTATALSNIRSIRDEVRGLPAKKQIEIAISQGRIIDYYTGRGYAEGGWTGPGSKHDVAGVVHADEYVLSKSARASVEAARPGLLDAMNTFGAQVLPAYADGGRVWSSAPDLSWIPRQAGTTVHVVQHITTTDPDGAATAVARRMSMLGV